MKKFLLFICFVASFVFGASAADYEMFIKKGLEWKELGCTSSPEPPAYDHLPKFIINYSLDNEVEYDGEMVLELRKWQYAICCEQDRKYYDRETVLVAYMKSEGSKVYYHPIWMKNPEWLLMYDFDLGVDEGCDVWRILQTSYTNINDKSTYVWCKDITENTIGGRVWEVMEMGEKRRSGINGEEMESHNTSQWLRGLGDIRGISSPNEFDLLGGGTQMVEASLDGEIIFKNYPAGIELPGTETLQVRVEGNQVRILGVSGRSDVYSSDGRLVGYTYDDAPLTLGDGLYIVRHGNKSLKVVL